MQEVLHEHSFFILGGAERAGTRVKVLPELSRQMICLYLKTVCASAHHIWNLKSAAESDTLLAIENVFQSRMLGAIMTVRTTVHI